VGNVFRDAHSSDSPRERDFFATRDGQVFRRDADGWRAFEKGSWNKVGDEERARALDRERAARTTGDRRYESYLKARERGDGASGARGVDRLKAGTAMDRVGPHREVGGSQGRGGGSQDKGGSRGGAGGRKR
jgi:hypothetical protein